MNLKAQFLKNNNMKVLTGGGGDIGSPSAKRNGTGGSVSAPLNVSELGHGNSAGYKANNRGSKSRVSK